MRPFILLIITVGHLIPRLRHGLWSSCLINDILAGLAVSFYLESCRLDPGPFCEVGMIECDKCNRSRPERASHCRICNKCVYDRSHHCPWLGSCIGQNNLKSFLRFLVSILFAGAATSSLCAWNLFHLRSTLLQNSWLISDLVFGLVIVMASTMLLHSEFISLTSGITAVESMKPNAKPLRKPLSFSAISRMIFVPDFLKRKD